MGLLDSLKKLFGGGKQEEQTQGQAQEGETSAPEQSGCGHCDSSESQEEAATESGEEDRPQ